jgi:sterol desaturase/sphingolipid hydroxylase (fatty acid hydroxylase superfamily)
MFTIWDGVFFAMFAAFAALDFAYRARAFPKMRFWRARGVASVAVYFALATYAPLMWAGWLGERTLFDITGWHIAGQLVAALLVAQLIAYLWHRMLHVVPITWRLHQTHHSVERMDVWGAFYFHPLDTVGFAFAGTLALIGVLGVSVPVAIAVTLAGAFLDMFTHANLKTPHWLGFFIARPEMHAAHHERGVHKYNYASLPLIDMVFGTYRNPKTFEAEVGFYDGASERIGDLLLGRKVYDDAPAAARPAPAE